MKPSDPFSGLSNKLDTRVVTVPGAGRGRKWRVCRVRKKWCRFLNCRSAFLMGCYCQDPRYVQFNKEKLELRKLAILQRVRWPKCKSESFLVFLS